MKIITTEQGTDEWLEARRSHITASMVDCVMAGRWTQKRAAYLEELALDVAGVPCFNVEEPAPWFADGHTYEAWARGWYSWETGLDVGQTGFCESDSHPWLGMSPDGLVGDRGMVEIKFRKSLTTWRKHTSGPIPRMTVNQMQAQLWVADRDWVDYVNFWRDDQIDREEGSVRRVRRDQARIDYLEELCLAFWGEVLIRAAEISGDPRASAG